MSNEIHISTSLHPDSPVDGIARSLRRGVVLRVREDACEIVIDGRHLTVGYAPRFPAPRIERVAPGNLVAVATGPDGTPAIVWRWYDAVVLDETDKQVTLWEPNHGEVSAQPRPAYVPSPPGTRAYLSAGLPGADWWVAGPAAAGGNCDVELDEVELFCAEYNLWDDDDSA